MSLEGDLTTLALPRVLQSIAASRQSGILTVQGEDDIVAVSFLEGRIVAADALNQTVEEGLGEVLEESGLVTPQDLEAVVREHQGTGGGSLGELLTSRGLIGHDDLLEGLRTQTYRLMLQILTWKQGEFKFYDGDEVSYEEGLVPITVEELLIRSIGDLDGRGGVAGPVPDLASIYRPLPTQDAVRVLGRDGDGSEGGVWIGPETEAFLAAADGTTTAAELADRLEIGRYPALYAVHDLLRNGLIEDLGPPQPVLDAVELDPSEPELRAEIFTPPEPGAPQPGAAPPGAPQPGPPPGEPEPVAAELTAEPAALEPVAAGEPVSAASMPVPAAAARARENAAAGRVIGPGLALLLAAGLALALARAPRAYLLPFPWQEAQRSGIERQLRQSLYLKLDRAAKTFFHLEGSYPEDLGELVDRGLLQRQDLRDQAGLELAYATDEGGYRVDPLAAGGPLLGQGSTEAITGDFFLDPQFDNPPTGGEDPLFLID